MNDIKLQSCELRDPGIKAYTSRRELIPKLDGLIEKYPETFKKLIRLGALPDVIRHEYEPDANTIMMEGSNQLYERVVDTLEPMEMATTDLQKSLPRSDPEFYTELAKISDVEVIPEIPNGDKNGELD